MTVQAHHEKNLSRALDKVTFLSNENWPLFLVLYVQTDNFQMTPTQTFWYHIISIHTFRESRCTVVVQQHLFSLDVSITILGALFSLLIRAYDAFNDVHKPGCNDFLSLRTLKRGGDVQDCLYAVHDRGITAHISGPFVRELPQLDFFCFSDRRPFFVSNEINHNEFLNFSQLTVHVQPSGHLEKMTPILRKVFRAASQNLVMNYHAAG